VTLLVVSVTAIWFFEVQATGTALQAAGGAMEGKEVRFGEAASALYAAATTGTSTGSVNSMHDSFTPFGGGVAMINMLLGEVTPGGVGSGLYSILVLAIITVFIAGLMVGRTPEYLGKKVDQATIRAAALYILVTPALVLIGTAIAMSLPEARASMLNSGPHGFSEVLYAFASAGNNNGSAFAGLSANTTFYNTALGVVMLLGRFVPIVLALTLAGALARQGKVPDTEGTLPTHKPLFITLLVGTVVVIGGLTYFPALALGPFAEGLSS
jgi:K+-transporting ATPase ATPase A chain